MPVQAADADNRIPSRPFLVVIAQGRVIAMEQRAPAPRMEVNCPAWIDLADGSPLQRCTAVNLSRTGAKLSVGRTPLPEQFIVRFAPSSGIAMLCKLIWSREGAVGVHFFSRVDAAMPAARAGDEK